MSAYNEALVRRLYKGVFIFVKNQVSHPLNFILPLIVSLAGNLIGCAFGDRHVDLKPLTPAPLALQVSSSPRGYERTLSVTPPQDLRPDRAAIGNVRNGYFIVTSQVRSNNDIPLWVTNSLVSALEQRGYQFERVETVDRALTPIVIEVLVKQVFVDHQFLKLGARKADVVAQVNVYKEQKVQFQQEYTGSYESFLGEFVSVGTSSEYQSLMEKALSNFLQKTVPPLDTELAKFFEAQQKK